VKTFPDTETVKIDAKMYNNERRQRANQHLLGSHLSEMRPPHFFSLLGVLAYKAMLQDGRDGGQYVPNEKELFLGKIVVAFNYLADGEEHKVVVTNGLDEVKTSHIFESVFGHEPEEFGNL
jgi:hypothetical protein